MYLVCMYLTFFSKVSFLNTWFLALWKYGQKEHFIWFQSSKYYWELICTSTYGLFLKMLQCIWKEQVCSCIQIEWSVHSVKPICLSSNWRPLLPYLYCLDVCAQFEVLKILKNYFLVNVSSSSIITFYVFMLHCLFYWKYMLSDLSINVADFFC